MTSNDPLDVSPYLTLPHRDVRSACRALIRHADRRTPCGACPVSDLCERSAAKDDRVCRHNAPYTLPTASLTLNRAAAKRPEPVGRSV